MMQPTIHLNGTSKESLFGQYEKALDAINAAIEAVVQCAPNGRDYYPQGPAAYEKASEEHGARLLKLTDIKAEIMELAEATA